MYHLVAHSVQQGVVNYLSLAIIFYCSGLVVASEVIANNVIMYLFICTVPTYLG